MQKQRHVLRGRLLSLMVICWHGPSTLTTAHVGQNEIKDEARRDTETKTTS